MSSGDGAAQRLRRAVTREGGSACARCFSWFGAPLIRIDHTLALFRGGHDLDSNVQTLCVDCHRMKSKAERSLV